MKMSVTEVSVADGYMKWDGSRVAVSERVTAEAAGSGNHASVKFYTSAGTYRVGDPINVVIESDPS